MLVYLATYPRCGNSFLRGMIVENWDYWVSTVYPVPREAIAAKWSAIGYAPLADGLAAYSRGTPRRMIQPGCALDRERLAADPAIFFIKTHELPFERYFPGEVVIQMVRHPVAAIWSYKRLLDRTKDRDYDILDVSAGKVQFGPWSAYHDAWEGLAVRVRYEDALTDESAAVRTIADAVGLPLGKVRFTDFAAAHAKNPVRFRQGTADGWQSLPQRTIDRIMADHRVTAERLGYHVNRSGWWSRLSIRRFL